MIAFVHFILDHALTLGILCFLLITVPIVGIMIVNDPD
jgi:predicted PurR-regulated permease PerM